MLAAPYRDQHLDIVAEEGEGAGTRRWVNQGESPLGWLRRRRGPDGAPLVSAAQFMAGERLRSDFERAGIPPRVTSIWADLGSAVDGGGGARGPNETQLRCRQRLARAVAAMGPGLGDVVVRVCCYQESLSAIEAGQRWPARSAKVVLGLGLDRLRDFYGIGEI